MKALLGTAGRYLEKVLTNLEEFPERERKTRKKKKRRRKKRESTKICKRIHPGQNKKPQEDNTPGC